MSTSSGRIDNHEIVAYLIFVCAAIALVAAVELLRGPVQQLAHCVRELLTRCKC